MTKKKPKESDLEKYFREQTEAYLRKKIDDYFEKPEKKKYKPKIEQGYYIVEFRYSMAIIDRLNDLTWEVHYYVLKDYIGNEIYENYSLNELLEKIYEMVG